ncbi:MAG: sulfotransferase [Alphaproteobacteria bacterium]
MTEYGPMARLLHRIALSARPIREMTFDLDQSVGGKLDDRAVTAADPVFVSGLARSGTSILLRALYSTGCFSTLTYRHMPFVLAPRLWRRFTAGHEKAGAETERAHGDGMNVSFDSPEAFEEVFWLTFVDDAYVTQDSLKAHDVDSETIEKFRLYVAAVTDCDRGNHKKAGARLRYLSKNNNNVLRFGAIRRAFPDAAIVVPFRHPLEQAASAHALHTRFDEQYSDDAFGRSYMRWLGHFEFGRDHRPALIGRTRERLAGLSPDQTDYWLSYWIAVHETLLEQATPLALRLVGFADLCDNPGRLFTGLFDSLGLDADPETAAGLIAAPAPRQPETGIDRQLETEALELYHALCRYRPA